MKNKTLTLKIKNDKYKLAICITDDLVKMVKKIQIKINRKKPLETKKEIKTWNGVALYPSRCGKKIFVVVKRRKGKLPVSTLTHEILHAVGKILRESDINYYENKETFACLDGELNAFVMSKLINLGEKLSYKSHEGIKISKKSII